MKVKTTNLKGQALDWAVATSLGFICFIDHPRFLRNKSSIMNVYIQDVPYSIDWAFGGPVIEKEGIDLRKRVPDPDIARPNPRFAWKAEMVATKHYHCGTGPTPLVAAMRCLVASKLGNEVEIPEGLV